MDFLTEEEVFDFREAFSLFDMDGSNGFITMEEMTIIMKSLGRNSSNEELKAMINRIDANDIKNYDFTNLLELTNKMIMRINKEDELKEVFKVFDSDQKGYISANQLKNVLINLGEKLTDEEAEQMIREADFDGDGKVNFDDFMRTMVSL